MGNDEQLQTELLAEMRALESFREDYVLRHPQSLLTRDDPDVHRLMEALAFFSLRTRRAGLRNLLSTWLRLFRSYFNDLLAPVPAAAMIQMIPNHRLVEPAQLARGAEVRIETQDGAIGSFRTLAPVRALPLTLVRTPLLQLPEGGLRLVLELRARSPRQEPVGLLRFHVRYLDDYPLSLRLLHYLRTRLRQAQVVYQDLVLEGSHGPACTVTFGAVADNDQGLIDPGVHPLSRIRSFFHFPEQELFLNIAVPPSPRPYSRVSLCLDLEPPWPAGLSPSPDLFRLFCVPAVNLRREAAETIVCDGTRDSYPIRHPSLDRGLALQSIQGVYRLSERGPEPLSAGALPGGDPTASFEIEEELTPRGRQHRLMVRAPEAFFAPQKISVDALWHQPGFAERAVGALNVSLPDRYLAGLDLRVLGLVRPPVESPLREDANGLLALLALRTKAPLALDDVRTLLAHMGTLAGGPFQELPARVRALQADIAPDAQRGSGLRHRYRAALAPYESTDDGLVTTFLGQVQTLLSAWTSDAVVDLREVGEAS